MVVISLSRCPMALRGDLTKWLMEISTGVYVGQVSARVRDKLWEKVSDYIGDGQAVMVYNAGNEQHFEFKVLNNAWVPTDYDGLTLIMRPNASQIKDIDKGKVHQSDAAKRRAAKKWNEHNRNEHNKNGHQSMISMNEKRQEPYVVLDFETTGLNPDKDRIIEIGAIRSADDTGQIEKYQTFVKIEQEIPKEITVLTGITEEMLNEGQSEKSAILELKEFVGNRKIIAHNMDFERSFLEAVCCRSKEEMFQNDEKLMKN